MTDQNKIQYNCKKLCSCLEQIRGTTDHYGLLLATGLAHLHTTYVPALPVPRVHII